MKSKNDKRSNLELNNVSPMFSKYASLIKDFAIKSREIIVWYRNNDDFETKQYFWCNDTLSNKIGVNRDSSTGLILSKDYYDSFVLDEEGLELIEKLKIARDKITSDETCDKVSYIVKVKNKDSNEIFYLDFILEVFERYDDGSLKVWGGNGVDVTSDFLQNKELEYYATHDSSTNLYNRMFINEYIKSSKMPSTYGVIVFDLDGLKIVNDAFGHREGDEVIKLIADLLKSVYKKGVVARIGGDEFLVIAPFSDKEYFIKRMELIQHKLNQNNEKHIIDIGLSSGYKIVENNNISYEEAFKTAESIMYSTKLVNSSATKSKSLKAILNVLDKESTNSKSIKQLEEHAVSILKGLGRNRKRDEDEIRMLSKVYDIGKIMIPENILQKSTTLVENEYRVIRKHPESGFKLIKNILNKENVSLGALHHHEWWDGSGYPFGLKGNNIPLFARIISVCDAYRAMNGTRPYSEKVSDDEILNELRNGSGKQFDPEIVEKFLKIIAGEDSVNLFTL